MKNFIKGFLSSFVITLGLSLSIGVFAGVGDINLISKIAPYNDGFTGMVDAEQVIAGTFPGSFIFDTDLSVVGTASTSQLCFNDATCMTTAPAGSGWAWSTSSEAYYWGVNFPLEFASSYNATTTLNGLTISNYLATANFSTYFDTDYNATTTLNGFTPASYLLSATAATTYLGLTDWYSTTTWSGNLTVDGFASSTALWTSGNSHVGGDLTVDGNVTGSNLAISNWNTAYGWGNHASAGYYASADFNTDWNSTYNATTTLNGLTISNYLATADFDTTANTWANASSTIGSKSYNDLEGSPSDRITDGTNLSWAGDTLNVIDSPTFAGTVTVNTDLQVDGNATTTGDLVVEGNTSLATTTMDWTNSQFYFENYSVDMEGTIINFPQVRPITAVDLGGVNIGIWKGALMIMEGEPNEDFEISGNPMIGFAEANLETEATITFNTTTQELTYDAKGGHIFDNAITINEDNLLVNGNSTTTGNTYLGTTVGLSGEYIDTWSDLSAYVSSGGSWATTSERYFWNNTSTWAYYDTNWDRNYNATTTLNGLTISDYLAIANFSTYFDTDYNATTTLNGFTDNSTNWDGALAKADYYATTTWAGGNNDLVVTGNATNTGISFLGDTTNGYRIGKKNLGGMGEVKTITPYNLNSNTGIFEGKLYFIDSLFFNGSETDLPSISFADRKNFVKDVKITYTTTTDVLSFTEAEEYTFDDALLVTGFASTTLGLYTQGNLEVEGNATTTGDLYVEGNTYLLGPDVYLRNDGNPNFHLQNSDASKQTGFLFNLATEVLEFSGASGGYSFDADTVFNGWATSTNGFFTQGNGHFGGNLTIDNSATTTNDSYIGDKLKIGGTQQYDIYEDGAVLYVQGQSSGSGSIMGFTSKDSDGTDLVAFGVFGENDFAGNNHLLVFGWDNTEDRYNIETQDNGTGVAKNLYIEADDVGASLELKVDNTIAMGGNLTITGNATTTGQGIMGFGSKIGDNPSGRYLSFEELSVGALGTVSVINPEGSSGGAIEDGMMGIYSGLNLIENDDNNDSDPGINFVARDVASTFNLASISYATTSAYMNFESADRYVFDGQTHIEGDLKIVNDDDAIVYFQNDDDTANSQIFFDVSDDHLDFQNASEYSFDSDTIIDGYASTTGGLYTQGDGHYGGGLTVDSRVGLGTETPDGTLHVHTGSAGVVSPLAAYDDITIENSTQAGITILSPDNAYRGIMFGGPDDADGGRIYYGGSNVADIDERDSLQFFTNGTRKVTIDTNGKVGIGTKSPGTSLVVNSTSGTGITIETSRTINDNTNMGLMGILASAQDAGYTQLADIRFVTDGSTINKRGGSIEFFTQADNDANNRLKRMTIANDGKVLMPYVYGDTVGATNRDLYIDNTGKLGYVSSGEKYKENITDLEKSDTSWIYDLQTRKYDRKDGSNYGEFGMVAEEVVEVYPKMVSFKRGERTVTTTNELGEEITEVEYFETDIPETVNYGSPHFITALLQQVQELFAKVQMAFSWNQDNEDRIELLEDENEALKARLDKLELNNELAK